MLNESKNNRRGTKSFKYSRACESLEARALFTVVPISPVADVQFQYETAPQKLVYRFNQDMSATLDTGDLVLLNDLSRNVVTGDALALQYDKATNTATFTFPGMDGVLSEGNWNAILSGVGMQTAPPDPTPIRLPGPSPVIEGLGSNLGTPNTKYADLPGPSPVIEGLGSNLGTPNTKYAELPGPSPVTEGNGSGTNENGDFVYSFSFLRGDATGDGVVDSSDFAIVARNIGNLHARFSDGDFDYNGQVDQADVGILIDRFGMNLNITHTQGSQSTSPFCSDPAPIPDWKSLLS